MIVSVNFSVLENSDVKNFWKGMLDTERRDADLNRYAEFTFINQTQEHCTNHPLSSKRKSTENVVTSVVEIDTFEETDSLHVEGMEENIATWIGRDGRATAVTNRKSRNFNALGRKEKP